MATIFKRGPKWRAQVRRKGLPLLSETFDSKREAQLWAREQETKLDKGDVTPVPIKVTFADLVDAYLESIRGKQFSASKMQTIERLRRMLGDKRIGELNKRVFLEHAQKRENQGAGPPALDSEFSYLGVVLRFGGSAADVDEHTAQALVHLSGARAVLAHAGRIGAGQERDRRPTEAELAQLAAYCHEHVRLVTPLWDMSLFAIATAMRLGEICRIRWEDFDPDRRLIIIRDRKDPKKKAGNDMSVPLLKGPFTYKGVVVDPVDIMRRQRSAHLSRGPIFPFQPTTTTRAFGTAVEECGIDDLTFHDLRHDAISRLFEAGYRIEEVAVVSGHRSWKNLQRYTHLRPQNLHRT